MGIPIHRYSCLYLLASTLSNTYLLYNHSPCTMFRNKINLEIQKDNNRNSGHLLFSLCFKIVQKSPK